tara:strand:- start:5038 stop:7065 length:2028 start_codon:yes stop_codon:yes gene_type:complete
MSDNTRRIRKDKKNTRNPDSNLFKKLTRLLSGPLVLHRTQTARRLRRRQLDKYANRFKSASGQQFKKTEYNPFDNLMANVMSNQTRLERYVDFDQMEYTPEIASALDIYADEMTTSSALQPLLTIDCPNDEIKNILDNLYHKVLNIEFNLFGWSRTMCKYGDFFLYLDIDEDLGIKSVIGLPGNELERLEGEDKTNPNYVQYQWNSAGMTFENWQISHFRILGNDKHAPYGTSALEPARRIWRQLTLLEDAMMAYRIVRSPERRVFYIDTGGIAPQDVEQYMQKVMTSMKRNQVVDPKTGRVDLRYNPMSVDEDYFIPVRGQISSKVESLPGGTYTGDIDDVKYLRDKLFSALKIPASYLSAVDGGEEDKATLAQKDIRFARTVQRLQRSIVTELEKIGLVHLYVLGFRGVDLTSFKISLSNPSKIAELQELEHWKVKFEAASNATEGYFSKRWVASNVFNMSEEEFLRNQREIFHDRKIEAALEVTAEKTQAELSAGGAGGLEGQAEAGEAGEDAFFGSGAPDGGDPSGGTGTVGDEPELGGGDDAAAGGDEPDSNLLAAPGKRDDKVGTRGRTASQRREEYDQVNHDGRRTDARHRAALASSGLKGGTASFSSTQLGLHPYKRDLDSLIGLNGLKESKKTTYNKEEKIISDVTQEMRLLIENLELRKKNENKA